MSARGVGTATALVLGSRLLLVAPGAGAEDATVPPPRVEIGGSAGVIWRFPTVGVIGSVPAASWLAAEATVNRVAGNVISQGQLRVPIGRHRPTRRGLVAGLTHVARREGQFTPGLHAHAGASFQQAIGRQLDLRFDVQLLLPLRHGPDADPRAIVAVMWHR
jgi:hypothetical protein